MKFNKYGFTVFCYMITDWYHHLKLAHRLFPDEIFWANLNTEIYNENIRQHKRDWIKHHEESKILAIKAENKPEKWSDRFWSTFEEAYYYHAAQNELKALVHLNFIVKPPDYIILNELILNAVALLIKAGELEEARKVAIRWMGDNRIYQDNVIVLSDFLDRTNKLLKNAVCKH